MAPAGYVLSESTANSEKSGRLPCSSPQHTRAPVAQGCHPAAVPLVRAAPPVLPGPSRWPPGPRHSLTSPGALWAFEFATSAPAPGPAPQHHCLPSAMLSAELPEPVRACRHVPGATADCGEAWPARTQPCGSPTLQCTRGVRRGGAHKAFKGERKEAALGLWAGGAAGEGAGEAGDWNRHLRRGPRLLAGPMPVVQVAAVPQQGRDRGLSLVVLVPHPPASSPVSLVSAPSSPWQRPPGLPRGSSGRWSPMCTKAQASKSDFSKEARKPEFLHHKYPN